MASGSRLSLASPVTTYIAVLILSVAVGLVSSSTAILAAAIGIGTAVSIGLAGKRALLGYTLMSSAVGFGVFAGFDAGALGSVGGGRIEAVRILVALLACAVISVRERSLMRGLRYIWLYAVLVGLAFVSIVWSPDRLNGLLLLCKLLYPIGVFLVALEVTRFSGPRVLFDLVAAAVAVAVVLDVGVSILGLSPYVGIGYEGRLHGASHPNAIGHFGVVASLIMYMGWRIYRKARFAVFGIAAIGEAVWSGSRTALVAGFVGFILLELIERRPKRIILAVLAGVAVWLAVPTLGARTTNTSISTDVQAGNTELNLSGRLTLWQEAWDAFSGNAALFGHGLGATEHFFSNLYVSLRSVHNGYLFLIFDLGIIGLIVACLFYLLMATQLARRGLGNDRFASMSAALIGVFLVSNIAESAFTGFGFQATAVWASLGLAVSRWPSLAVREMPVR